MHSMIKTCVLFLCATLVRSEVPVSCGRPPPLVDGDTKETLKSSYEHNEKVEYVCQRLLVMEGGPHKTCINGEWTGEMRCFQYCTLDKKTSRSHHIQFSFSRRNKLYMVHNDEVQFTCETGYTSIGVDMRQTCLNGVIQLPTCQ